MTLPACPEAADHPEDRFCDLPTGMRLCYRTRGNAGGQPLLLIAGHAQSSWSQRGGLSSRAASRTGSTTA
jgi:hypothetical protein